MRNFYYILCLLSFYIFTACGSITNGVHFFSKSTYKNGYWGDWQTASFKSKSTYYDNGNFVMIVYSSFSHPSDFDIEITASKFLGKNNNWYEYNGIVKVAKSYEATDLMGDYHTKKESLYNYSNGRYLTYPCTIRLTKPIKDIYKKHGVVNIFYNGVGRAYQL